MKLINFTANNIHGYLNFNIEFREDVTFLIGINGTGKTSVLKLILGLISPSYNYLNQIEFESAYLSCAAGDTMIKISAEKLEKEKNFLSIKLQVNGEEEIAGKLLHYQTQKDSELSKEEIRERLNHNRSAFENEEVYSRIKELATPLFLGIDRRIYEGHEIDRPRNYYLRRKLSHFPTGDALNFSLIDVQGLVYDYYRIIAARQPRINEKFKNKIFAQTFEFIETPEINILKDFKDLKKKKSEILEATNNLKVGEFEDAIEYFFDQMEDILRKLNDSTNNEEDELSPDRIKIFRNWFTNQPQLKRIDEIIEFSQSYQEEINQLYDPINRLIELINQFFEDSKKLIQIDDRGDISVLFQNGREAELYELSSGEKQIISMLANLIFFHLRFHKDEGIFIIDEPELSLHLAWQEIFVKSLQEASPKTQFIMATHSPAIISEYGEEHCEDLVKLN